jgi:hypothetical protein
MTIPIWAVWAAALVWTVMDYAKAWRMGADFDNLNVWLVDRAMFCGSLSAVAWLLS